MRAQRKKRKLSFSSIFSRRQNRLGAVDEALAVGGSVFSGTKTLLNDISGEARDGEIMAVLGASGSEKSTLIDALANRIAKGRLKGTLALNGEALESSLLKVISAYVLQDDLLYPMLTVDETLTFAAEFRLPPAPPIWRPHTSFTMLRDYEYEFHSPFRSKGLFC